MSIKEGIVLNNLELCKYFQCSPQGGMRRSLSTNSLVLISNHIKSIYDDRWLGNIFHYTGMGMEGDQELNYSQNKTLNESMSNGIKVYLFEVFREQEYTYIGEVALYDKPYKEIQLDQNKNERTVWIFH